MIGLPEHNTYIFYNELHVCMSQSMLYICVLPFFFQLTCFGVATIFTSGAFVVFCLADTFLECASNNFLPDPQSLLFADEHGKNAEIPCISF